MTDRFLGELLGHYLRFATAISTSVQHIFVNHFIHTIKMAPKHSEKSFLSAAYEQITSPEHKTIVRSILVFGAGVAFLHSSLSELLLPPA
ncbi:hypothetical protein BDV09DRAFT_174071 [Aspergillus tetrazonus]